jgi:ABC-type nitrate/sulfonate/bicarbonate transport system ATPase subunit
VLHDVTLSVERGEFVSIVGMMGCGKSTLLKIVAGLLAPDAGQVIIDGEAVDVRRGVRRDAAFVFQNYSLLPWFSALENVRLAVGAAFPDWPKERQRQQATRHLEAVGLGQALQRRPGQLSGGMRQRVAIARAFAIEPAILLLDEPFGALDALTRESLALLLSDRIVPMTGRRAVGSAPGRGTSLGAAVAVELPRPRSANDLVHDDCAARVRAKVVASLTEDLERTRRARNERAA